MEWRVYAPEAEDKERSLTKRQTANRNKNFGDHEIRWEEGCIGFLPQLNLTQRCKPSTEMQSFLVFMAI